MILSINQVDKVPTFELELALGARESCCNRVNSELILNADLV